MVFDGGPGVLTDANNARWLISCSFGLTVTEPAEVVIQVAASRSAGDVLHEHIELRTTRRVEHPVEEISGPDGTRLLVVDAERGGFDFLYRAEIRAISDLASTKVATKAKGPKPVDPYLSYDRQVYLRPSRYCPSDLLIDFADAEFGRETDIGIRVLAITDWIHTNIEYVPGSSTVHDSAEDTRRISKGTCRDFAHLGVALSRATGVPARFVAAYAPGMTPMDFHAVFETFECGQWCVHDATQLAARTSLVRVATGRDAADTAFVAFTNGVAKLDRFEVTATVDPLPPRDDHRSIFNLA